MNLEVDRSRWSPASQRSSGGNYDAKAKYYENIACQCRKCTQSFGFTAAEQKRAYEERQEFVGYTPSLCPTCQAAWSELRQAVVEFEQSWASHKEERAKDRQFLERWRSALREIESFGRKGSNPSLVVMINKQLAQLG